MSEKGEVGCRGRRLVYWFRPGFVCHFGCASYFVYESFGPPPLSSSDFASRRHQSEPGLLLLPPFSFPADFVVSWRWLVDLRRWQLKGSGIKAEQKPSRRTISYNGKGLIWLQELAEKTHFLARGLFEEYLEGYILYKPYWRISIWICSMFSLVSNRKVPHDWYGFEIWYVYKVLKNGWVHCTFIDI